jgi:ABC-2 type transport system permease protein
MTSLAHSARDSATMLRRDLRHSVRFPLLTISGVTMPILFLLLFDCVLGSALRAGLGAAAPAGGSYVDYLAPGILVMTVCAAAESTAINVSTDMSEGIITRFRTMAISRTSVLTGQVLGSFLRTMVSGVLVLAVAIGLGFRPHAGAGGWLAAAAVFALLTVAVTWLTVAFGLFAKTPGGANSLSLIVVMLPFVSSAYVPTDSMPAGVRWFAEHQPFTPVIQTLRGLLAGTPTGHDAVLAVAWCGLIAARRQATSGHAPATHEPAEPHDHRRRPRALARPGT